MSKILGAKINDEGVLAVAVDRDPSDRNLRVMLNGVILPGMIDRAWGWWYRDPSGIWGVPGMHWGDHQVSLIYDVVQPVVTAPFGALEVKPPSTLAGVQLDDVTILDGLYRVRDGFVTETELLTMFAICVTESGKFTKARNWRPAAGFRPLFDTLGVGKDLAPPMAFNDAGQQCHSDRGPFQVSSDGPWGRYSDAEVDDPARACAIARTIYLSGGFSQWAAFTSGRAQQIFDAQVHGWGPLRPIVQNYLASKAG